MSAYKELEGQLVQSVAARSRARGGPVAGLGRWWRATVRRGGLSATLSLWLVVAVAAVGVATDVGRADRSPSEKIPLLSAQVLASPCASCRPLRDQLHGAMARTETVADNAERPSLTRETRERRGLPVVFWSSREAESSEAQASRPSAVVNIG